MSNQNFQRDYWASNLDTKNLGKSTPGKGFDLDEELLFYFSPEQQYAVKKLWGDFGLKGKRILEIGCGLGVFALFLARQEAEVYVVDLALERLSLLKKQAVELGLEDRVHIICGVAEALPFKDGFFDAAYTKSVLIHTRLEGAAREIRRVIKKGGVGVFVEPLRSNPFAAIYRRFFGPRQWRSITTYFDKKRIHTLARPFKKAGVRYFFLFGFLAFFWQFGWRKIGLFKFFLALLCRFDNMLFRVFPSLKHFAWFAVISVEK